MRGLLVLVLLFSVPAFAGKPPLVPQDTPVLHQPSRDLTANEIKSTQFTKLVSIMRKTMRRDGGVGIAAPQIGVGVRVVIAKRGPLMPEHVMINPSYIPLSEQTHTASEGCLSVDGSSYNVERYKEILVGYQKPDGSSRVEIVRGYMARVMQHEIDHINGVLIVDRGDRLSFPSF